MQKKLTAQAEEIAEQSGILKVAVTSANTWKTRCDAQAERIATLEKAALDALNKLLAADGRLRQVVAQHTTSNEHLHAAMYFVDMARAVLASTGKREGE